MIPYAEQQRQCDDVGGIERDTVQHAKLQRNDAGEQERDERQQHVRQAARCHGSQICDPEMQHHDQWLRGEPPERA